LGTFTSTKIGKILFSDSKNEEYCNNYFSKRYRLRLWQDKKNPAEETSTGLGSQ